MTCITMVFTFNCSRTSETDSRYLAEKNVITGIAKYKNGDYYLAITDWKKALRLVPDDAEVHNFVGIAYNRMNALDSAIAYFRTATELNPDYYQAFNNLGYAYYNKKNYAEAESCFMSSINKKSDYVPAITNLKNTRKTMARIAKSDSIERRYKLYNGKTTVAVLNLNAINLPEEIAKASTLRLRAEIKRIGNYYLVENKKLRQIQGNNDFRSAGCTSPECLQEAGNLLKVDYVIGGTITGAGNDTHIELQLIQTKTGRVMAMVSEKIAGDKNGSLTKGIKHIASELSSRSKV